MPLAGVVVMELCPDHLREQAKMRASSSALLRSLNLQMGRVWPCGHHRTPETTHTVAGAAQCRACRRARLKKALRRIVARMALASIRSQMGAHRKAAVYATLRERARLEERRLPLDVILGSVGEQFGLTPDDIRGRTRTAPHVEARAIVATILHERGLSYPAVGRLLGGRDHSTIINLVHKFDIYGARNPLVWESYALHADWRKPS